MSAQATAIIGAEDRTRAEDDLANLEPWLVAELERGAYRYCDFTGRLDPPTDEGYDG